MNVTEEGATGLAGASRDADARPPGIGGFMPNRRPDQTSVRPRVRRR